MKNIKGLKKIYKNLSQYNRDKLLEANCKVRKRGKISLSKEEKLLIWCKRKKVFSKADVIGYGMQSFYLRSDRSVRDFVQQGIVRKLDKTECIQRNLKGNMAWYEFIGA